MEPPRVNSRHVLARREHGEWAQSVAPPGWLTAQDVADAASLSRRQARRLLLGAGVPLALRVVHWTGPNGRAYVRRALVCPPESAAIALLRREWRRLDRDTRRQLGPILDRRLADLRARLDRRHLRHVYTGTGGRSGA